MQHEILVLSALKILTVLAGLGFLTLAARAYLKHRTRDMLVLTVAMLLLTSAAISEGIAFQVIGLELGQAHIVEAVFTLAGFLVLLGSAVLSRARQRRGVPRPDFEGESG